jgi:hypothetical protein
MSTLGSRSVARNGKALAPAFLERRWKKGQSGNPSGHTAEYGEVLALARFLAPRAIERLGELMESEDERVAAVACNAILDRAFGKPREQTSETSSLATLSDEELDRRLIAAFVARGMSERQARYWANRNPISPARSAR